MPVDYFFEENTLLNNCHSGTRKQRNSSRKNSFMEWRLMASSKTLPWGVSCSDWSYPNMCSAYSRLKTHSLSLFWSLYQRHIQHLQPCLACHWRSIAPERNGQGGSVTLLDKESILSLIHSPKTRISVLKAVHLPCDSAKVSAPKCC